jgi:hypothetical protein
MRRNFRRAFSQTLSISQHSVSQTPACQSPISSMSSSTDRAPTRSADSVSHRSDGFSVVYQQTVGSILKAGLDK